METRRVLGLLTALTLAGTAYVHLHLAHLYDGNRSSLVSQGALFRTQAVVCLVLAVAVLVLHRSRLVWTAAALTLAGSLVAVLVYRYADVGAVLGLPNMYEPVWEPSEKVLSAAAEAIGLLLCLAGLVSATSAGGSRHRHGRVVRQR